MTQKQQMQKKCQKKYYKDIWKKQKAFVCQTCLVLRTRSMHLCESESLLSPEFDIFQRSLKRKAGYGVL